MAIKRVQFPDGSIHRVEVPDDATNEQIIAFVQSQQPAPQWQPTHRSPADIQAAAQAYRAANPNEATGTGGQNFLAGVGKSLVDTGQGLQQLYASAADAIAPRQQNIAGLVSGQANSRSAEIQQQVDERRNIDQGLMSTAGGNLGYIAGQGAQFLLPVGDGVKGLSYLGKAAPYVKAAAEAGAFSALQPVASGETRTGNALAGAAYGAAGVPIAKAGNVVKNGIVSRLPAIEQKLAQAADAIGIRLGVGQLSQNPMVRTVVSQMERLPLSGAGKRGEQNQVAFNKAVGDTFGLPEGKITPDKFGQQKQALGQAFDTLASRNTLVLDPTSARSLSGIQNEAFRLAGTDTGNVVKGWIDELLSKADPSGNIPGEAFQSFNSRIGKAMKAGGEKSHYLGQVRDVVMQAMDNSISPRDSAAWKVIRRQYANLKTVEPLVAKSVDGNISPAALMGRVTSDNAGKVRMASDQGGPLGDLARIGQRYLKAAPNSGTADRALVNLSLLGGLYGAQHEGYISPENAAITGGLLLGNRAATKALTSRALVNGEGRTVNGLSRLLGSAPRALPAAANAGLLWRPMDNKEKKKR